MSLLLKVGTRASALAQAQAKQVAEQLLENHSSLRVELVFITTSGDQGVLGPEANLKALFTKEIEDALLERRVDLAVHSAKDLGAEVPQGLTIAAVPEREDPRDAWISSQNIPFAQLRQGARVATGSVRRSAQLRLLRPDLEIVAMRGNVDTRLRKLKDEQLDGLLLAAAGMNRLGRACEITETFLPEQMIPAVGQGCLAIQTRADDASTQAVVQTLNHAFSHAALLAERAFLTALGGDCQTPLAAYAHGAGDMFTLSGWIGSRDGRQSWRQTVEGAVSSPEESGRRLAQRLLVLGAKL